MNQIKRFESEPSHFVNMQLNGLGGGHHSASIQSSGFLVVTCMQSLQTPTDMWVTPIPAEVTFGAKISCE